MPAFGAPWRTFADPDNPGSARATRAGDLVAAGQVVVGGVLHHRARIFQDAPVEPDASACNVRVERPIHITAGCSAGAYFGYFSSAVEIAIFASEGGRTQELRRNIVWATTAAVGYWPSSYNGAYEFNEPLFFDRGTTAPGNVRIGVQVDVFAGGGAFIGGAGGDIATYIPEMTVEWLW